MGASRRSRRAAKAAQIERERAAAGEIVLGAIEIPPLSVLMWVEARTARLLGTAVVQGDPSSNDVLRSLGDTSRRLRGGPTPREVRRVRVSSDFLAGLLEDHVPVTHGPTPELDSVHAILEVLLPVLDQAQRLRATPPHGYDPAVPPEPKEWLALDQRARFELVFLHLASSAQATGHRTEVLEALSLALSDVESLLASGEVSEVNATLERLAARGVERRAALVYIATRLAELTLDAPRDEAPSEEAFRRAIAELSPEEWWGDAPDHDWLRPAITRLEPKVVRKTPEEIEEQDARDFGAESIAEDPPPASPIEDTARLLRRLAGAEDQRGIAWREQAERRLKEEREDLARVVLVRARAHEVTAGAIRRQIDALERLTVSSDHPRDPEVPGSGARS